MAPPPHVPSIHRRTSSSASRDSSSISHVSHPNMNIDRPHHLQRRVSSRSQRTNASASPKRPPRSSSSSRAGAATNGSSRSRSSSSKHIPRYSKSYQSYTFQHPRHSMSVSLRPAQPNRISFLPSPHPTSASLQSLLNDMERIRGSRLTTSSIVSTESSNPCRISPSPGGMRIWEIMTKMRNQGSRQLCWRGVNGSDPWFDPFESSDDSTNNDSTQDSKKDATQNINSHEYKPLNPYTELAKLPSHSPILTNYKRRLPNRADVGFSNPSEEEIRLKMAEVQKECEWQECSPRICLLTGFGVSKHASSTESTTETEDDNELHILCRKELELWNGGSIPGLPYAGRDLVDCYNMYQKFEEEYNNGSQSNETKRQSEAKRVSKKLKDPRKYSVFAPPLDALPSKSNLWKPRPFNDRPVGMKYLLACPIDLRDETENEPLFCTMALYLLPEDDTSSNNKFKGKISEDFFFPAGNWNTIEGPREEQSWRRRKRRAVFSYDPLDCKEDDLFLVVEVFRAARCANTVSEEVQETKKKGLGNKLKGTFKKSKSKTDTAGGSKSYDVTSDPSMGESGPKFLSPVSFSVVPAFPTNDTANVQQWPAGETMRVPLYACPEGSETQESFVERLFAIAGCQRGEYSSSTGDTFRSYAPITKLTKLIPLPGQHVDIFSSFIGNDFTQALLHEPLEIADVSDDGPSSRPLLLADVMGESAIGFDGEITRDGNAKSLRPKLQRLTPTPSSGYTSSFDIKEVLYMPPRFFPRKYEEDACLNATSFLNLLYVYPRLIRIADGPNNEAKLSLRVRVVEQELHEQSFDGADAVYMPLESVYNSSHPAGSPLVESCYTRLAASNKTQRDVPLRGEIKIRLPDVLDRRHFLQFGLCAVNDGLECTIIAETTVPFIISSKESALGGRVTTIIPNGLHRIQLGNAFQIHVETRLASTCHVSDPSVAAILRDYPLSSITEGPKQQLIIAPYVDMLSMASGQALKRHSLSLITIHMIGLRNQECPLFYYESLFDMFGSDAAWHRLVAWDNMDSLTSCFRGLFVILDKIKTCFSERDHFIVPIKYQQWLKSLVDSMDERQLLLQDNGDGDDNNPEEFERMEGKLNASFESSLSLKDSNSGIPELKQNLSMISRSSTKLRSPRKASPAVVEAPFTRKAFVATRIEQMQADAELFDGGGEYFDDDQTVITYATATSRMTFATITSRMDRNANKPLESKRSIAADQANIIGSNFGFSTPPRKSPSNESSTTPFSFASKRAEYMANRVNTMAQLVMAPCMAPSLANTGPGNAVVQQSSKGRTNNSIWQSVQDTLEPGSDKEEEGQTNSYISLRGNQSCLNMPPLEFHLMQDTSAAHKTTASSSSLFMYEMISSLWVHSWTSFAAQLQGEAHLRGSCATVPLWPYEVIQGTNNPSVEESIATSFTRNASFFLPLMLKSLATRCSKRQMTFLVVPMTFLDDAHMQVFVPLVETIALGTIRDALSGSNSASNSSQMLSRSLATCQYSVDFLVGLFACLHPSQVSTLVDSFFSILEECEHVGDVSPSSSDAEHKRKFRRVKCTRTIRLHAVEMLAAMPKFIALNYPPKYTGYCPKKIDTQCSWTNQNSANPLDDSNFQTCLEKIDRYPQSFWLAGLLMDQCISVSLQCCKEIIAEARSQLNTSRYGNKAANRLAQEELLDLEALAFQAASCAHNILIKRHAMDSRFQTIESNTRVAAMFADQVLERLVLGVSVLSRLEPNQKVRTCWVLCLLYSLQEAPEVMLRGKLRSFCQDDNFYISEFVNLLTVANVTLQHQLLCSDDWFAVIGDKTKEMTQESFNCLAGSIILLVDECVDVVSVNTEKTFQLAKSTFSALLHLLSTPQSSVTLLRTLGGAAHAFDKFGASVFMRIVGDDLQHWGRIIFTLMNSTELSVRSMSVDFLVSLLGSVYNESGSIDSISLAFLTVLPEVAAREIALYHSSELTETMDDIEATLWPLRRAFADVEDTDPEDDDRVDPQLVPIVSTVCRTGQAILDGVLVDIRLKGIGVADLLSEKSSQSGRALSANINQQLSKTLFDADEESILEAATFFVPESSMPQKLRWLLTLSDIHISKAQWAEAAETFILSANSLLDSLPHLVEMWRPKSFGLWNDVRLSPWLSSAGLSNEQQPLRNETIMDFATSLLEPPGLVHASTNLLSVDSVCATLSSIVEQAYLAFDQEGHLQDLAYEHFESLLNKISLLISNADRRFHPQEISQLRHVRGTICAKLARLEKDSSVHGGTRCGLKYVRVILRGSKPPRFVESTTIPTYFEWNMPSICRVPMSLVSKARQLKISSPMKTEDDWICSLFAERYVSALNEAGTGSPVMLRIGGTSDVLEDDSNTYMDIAVVQMKQQPRSSGKSRKFFLRNNSDIVSFSISEFLVAHKFPHVLSRQRALVNDIVSATNI